MKKRWGLLLVSPWVLAGCAAGTHFNVPNKADRVPQWVMDTEAAIAKAEASAGARACPDKLAKAKDLGKKAVEVYWSCRDAEAEKLASEARDTAAAAEKCAGSSVGVHPVYFDTAQATLGPKAQATLEQAAKVLKDNPSYKFSLVGSTDSRGGDAYNQALGQRRAAAVRDYLVGRGVSADRLTTASVGETKPAASNDTPQGRAENRRVDVVIQK